jgi:ethanolamine utilization protein EutA (predicted chaperonin)
MRGGGTGNLSLLESGKINGETKVGGITLLLP